MEWKVLWEGPTEGSINWMWELLLQEGRYFPAKREVLVKGAADRGSFLTHLSQRE